MVMVSEAFVQHGGVRPVLQQRGTRDQIWAS